MFFKSLWNFFRCAFCTRRDCEVRYHIGARSYYSYLGFIKKTCPKEYTSYHVRTVHDIVDMMSKESDEEKN